MGTFLKWYGVDCSGVICSHSDHSDQLLIFVVTDWQYCIQPNIIYSLLCGDKLYSFFDSASGFLVLWVRPFSVCHLPLLLSNESLYICRLSGRNPVKMRTFMDYRQKFFVSGKLSFHHPANSVVALKENWSSDWPGKFTH